MESIDPLDFRNRENFAILENIVESLFDYEFTAEGSNIIPCLAIGYNWSDDYLNFTCHLRQDVNFHDGIPFNATVVKWNIDRIFRLKDHIYWDIWLHPDGTPILNFTKTQVIDEYTIKLVLNKPFVPFKAVLGNALKIVSPKSTPFDNFTRFETDKLVGTGPFKYNSSFLDYNPIYEEYSLINATLLRNRNYWGEPAKFDKIIIKIFENGTLKRDALISGEIHGGQAYPFDAKEFEDYEYVKRYDWVSTEINYITLNNTVINKTMRKAISYALDYDYLVPLGREWSSGPQDVIRTRSPLSLGMLYSNWHDAKIQELNITRARQVLIDANWPGTNGLTANDNTSSGNEWERLVNDGTPIAEYNFSYYVSQDWHRRMALMFQQNLTQIGINITISPETFWGYWGSINQHQFLVWGWFPDYNDPNSNIQLFHPGSSNDLSKINNTYLQTLIDNAIAEFNETLREQLFLEIQEYLVEEIYPAIWWYTPVGTIILSSKITGLNIYNNWDLPLYEWEFTSI